MKKKNLGIGVIVIVLVLIVIVVNFGLKEFVPEKQLPPVGDDVIVLKDSDGPVIEPEETLEIVSYTEIFPKEANNLITDNPEIIIIDVSSKYRFGHLLGAISYNLNDGTLDNELGSLDKQAKYLVYSSSDVEGRKAAQVLEDAYFQDVSVLKGSYGLWIQEGYDYEKSLIS